MVSELQESIQAVRRDIGNLLFHWTRRSEAEVNRLGHPRSATSILAEIIRTKVLQGSSRMIRGDYKCVCFTEAPITEAAALFRLAALTTAAEKPRYEPYGIAVKKDWLFPLGGRPVIYQSDSEFSKLPGALRWRHVRYEPDKGVDFTWEREWRIQTEGLSLDPTECLVVVPTAEEAFELMYGTAELEVDYDVDGSPEGACHVAKWMAVSLDFFGGF